MLGLTQRSQLYAVEDALAAGLSVDVPPWMAELMGCDADEDCGLSEAEALESRRFIDVA